MRINLPVTQREYALRKSDALVSKTDLRGVITYCNPPFVTVSGFQRDELIGKPHNLIRHPDMPREAFRDMWATLKIGKPWTALVKNRRKDGDHYWVRANVTPVVTGGEITGYMSVRTWASPGEIAVAEKLYAGMVSAEKSGKSLPTVLRAGRAVKPGRIRAALRALAGSMSLKVALAVTVGTSLPLLLPQLPWFSGHESVLAPMVVVVEALLGVYLYRRGVLSPLLDMATNARDVAAGDLNRNMFSRESFLSHAAGRELNQLNVNLRAVVGDVREEVHRFGATADGITRAVSDLAGRTESQAASLEEAAASMEEFTSSLQQNGERATDAARTSSEAERAATEGRTAITGVREAMDAIRKSSQDIGEITTLVDELAFQTNLLALNAAVEAARAGEHGRGFAVVVGEVRQLAQRSAAAARDIRALINTAGEHVERGQGSVEGADRQVESIVTAVGRARSLVSEIATSATEQAAAISQINDTITDLDSVTQSNAAMVQETRAAADSLRIQAHVLGQAVSVFHLSEAERSEFKGRERRDHDAPRERFREADRERQPVPMGAPGTRASQRPRTPVSA
jgi:aerotaxis receptor